MRGELLSALAVCEDVLARNEQNIAYQEVLITRQEAAGASASLSKSLLKTFHQLRLSHLFHRQTILCDLAALTNPRIEARAAVGLAQVALARAAFKVAIEEKPAGS
jgi:hypothetical protein